MQHFFCGFSLFGAIFAGEMQQKRSISTMLCLNVYHLISTLTYLFIYICKGIKGGQMNIQLKAVQVGGHGL